jgi:hypothetical protein
VFRIHSEQFEALGKLAHERFVLDAVAHVTRLPPCAAHRSGSVERWVRPRIERALALGLREELVVLRFLEAAARFDDAFVERGEVLAVLASPERATLWDETMPLLLALWAARADQSKAEERRGSPQ